MRERRRLRSDDPQQAIGLLLRRLTEDWGLSAAVISDADGLVLGGAARTPDVDLDALAAVRRGRDVVAMPLHYADVTLYLVAKGGAVRDHARAAEAVGRILDLGRSAA